MKKRHTDRYLALGTAVILGAFSLTGCAGSSTGVPSSITLEAPSAESNVVTVTGKESVKVVPDMARVVYGIHTQASDAKACQENNAQDLQAAIDVLKGLGIAETSIQTSSYGMNPIRNWQSDTQEITGYEMDTKVTVSDIPIAQVGQILAGSVEAGVNQVDSVSYFSSGYDESYQDALKLAVAMAREKADVLAEAGGRTVSAMTAVRETGYQPQTRYESMKNAASGVAAMETAADMAVMPGEISVEAQVEVDFLLQ